MLGKWKIVEQKERRGVSKMKGLGGGNRRGNEFCITSFWGRGRKFASLELRGHAGWWWMGWESWDGVPYNQWDALPLPWRLSLGGKLGQGSVSSFRLSMCLANPCRSLRETLKSTKETLFPPRRLCALGTWQPCLKQGHSQHHANLFWEAWKLF